MMRRGGRWLAWGTAWARSALWPLGLTLIGALALPAGRVRAS
jgi:hypothetical protein